MGGRTGLSGQLSSRFCLCWRTICWSHPSHTTFCASSRVVSLSTDVGAAAVCIQDAYCMRPARFSCGCLGPDPRLRRQQPKEPEKELENAEPPLRGVSEASAHIVANRGLGDSCPWGHVCAGGGSATGTPPARQTHGRGACQDPDAGSTKPSGQPLIMKLATCCARGPRPRPG